MLDQFLDWIPATPLCAELSSYRPLGQVLLGGSAWRSRQGPCCPSTCVDVCGSAGGDAVPGPDNSHTPLTNRTIYC